VTFGAQIDLDVLAVVVGELASNAAVHQTADAEITLELLPGGVLEVSVSDPSEKLPLLVDEEPWSTDGHRGIQLVNALAQEWGVEPAPPGKRVWARLVPADSRA
jgi:anti-sigma regulatory factor (Ser/Thr protein kinase)